MALRREDFAKTLCFAHEDERVIRYLKGETINLTEDEVGDNGWYLICVGDYPLGFGKRSGMIMKNKYFLPWRMN